jgi:hypothetical protein
MQRMPSSLGQRKKAFVTARWLRAHLREAVGAVAVILCYCNKVELSGYRHGLQQVARIIANQRQDRDIIFAAYKARGCEKQLTIFDS